MSKVVLSLRPLEKAQLEALRNGGHPDTVRSLSAIDLRAMGIRRAVATVRGTRAEEFLVAGSAGELEIYGAVLAVVSLIASAGVRRFHDLDTHVSTPIHRGRTLVAAGRVALRSVWGMHALRRHYATLAEIERDPYPSIFFDGKTERVLYLKSGPWSNHKVGGSVGHVAGVANAFHRLGHKVRMLAAARQLEVAEEIDQVITPPDSVWSLPLEMNTIRYARRYLEAAAEQTQIWKPNITYQRYSPNDFTGALLRRRFGIPWILEYNGSEVWAQRNWGKPMRLESIAKRIEEAVLRSADLVVTVSEPLRQEVLALGVPEERLLFYPNGIDPTRFDSARFGATDRQSIRQELDLTPDDTVLTFVGTFGPWHGADALADTIRTLIDIDPDWLRIHRIRFLFIGDGMMYPYVARKLSEPVDEEFVRLAGVRPQHQTPLILAASDVLLSPHVPNPDGSRFFGSPTKLFEYMAMAKPIVASALEQIGHVARGWQPGEQVPSDRKQSTIMILTEPGNIRDLARGIREAVEMSEGARELMGAHAREAALRGFTWNANVAAVVHRLLER